MINSRVRRMTELYSHPNNANRFAWFTESFIGAFLLHPDSKARVTEIMTKFNQQLEQQNQALEGVFELYYTPLNHNRYDHYIYAFLNSLILHTDHIGQAMALTKVLNDCLIYPLNKEEQAETFWKLEMGRFDDLSN